MALGFFGTMLRQVVKAIKKQRHVQEQAFYWMPCRFLAAAQEIVPEPRLEHIERRTKAGICLQLFDRKKNELVQDFGKLSGPNPTHVVNAISPAFSARFESYHHILSESTVN